MYKGLEERRKRVKISYIKMENSQRVLIMHIIVLSLNFLTVNKLSKERYFIVWAAKLNHHFSYKGIMTSKFGCKDMLLWKRGSLVSTVDENLWIASRPIWLDETRPPERVL